jgi:hypothetical protein
MCDTAPTTSSAAIIATKQPTLPAMLTGKLWGNRPYAGSMQAIEFDPKLSRQPANAKALRLNQ